MSLRPQMHSQIILPLKARPALRICAFERFIAVNCRIELAGCVFVAFVVGFVVKGTATIGAEIIVSRLGCGRVRRVLYVWCQGLAREIRGHG